MSSESYHDQAEELRNKMKEAEVNQKDVIDPLTLPPRSKVHGSSKKKVKKKEEKNKSSKFKVRFLLVRLLVILFLILVILVSTYPLWSEKYPIF